MRDDLLELLIAKRIAATCPNDLHRVDRYRAVCQDTLSVLGHFLRWTATDMQADPVRLTSDLQFIMEGDVRRALQKMAAPAPRG